MATTALGRLTLDLAVRMSEFTDGLTRAQRETEDATNNMSDSVTGFKDTLIESLSGSPIGGAIDTLNSKLGSITEAFGANGLAGAAGLGAAGAVAGLAAIGVGLVTLALQTAESDQQLERLAKRAKTSTENLQVLTAATASYGLEMESVGDILADAQEKLGEFSANGGGGLVDTLELMAKATKMTEAELEVFGRSLSTMDSVDAIQAVVDEMEKAGATTQEVRFVTESLASGLGDIIPLWDNNGEALRNYDRDLNQAGVIRSKESIEQTKFLASEVNKLKLEYEGMSNQVVTQALPAMAGLIKYMQRGTEDANGLSNSMSSIGIIAAALATPVIGIISVFKQFSTVIVGLAVSVGALFNLISDVLANPFEAGTYLKNYMKSTGDVGVYMGQQMKAERDKSVAALTDVWSSPQELADRRTAQAYTTSYGGKGINTSFNSLLNNSTNKSSPYRTGGIPYANGAITPQIVASNTIAKESAKATKENTKALNSNTKAKAVASQSLADYVAGGHYDTGKGGHYGAARAGRPKGHQALDISTPMGTQIYAPESGKYTFANTPNGTGGRIGTLTGDSGKVYRFFHLLNSTIESGSRVDMGDPIAKSGNSGSRSGGKRAGQKGDGYATHLHIEVFDSKGRRLDPTNMKVGGTAKQKTDLASVYDADNREAEQAKAKKDQAAEIARKKEEARKLAGQNISESSLAQSAKIDLEAKKLIAEANRTLNDRPNDLATALADIERNRVKAQKDLDANVMKPVLTKEDDINLDYEDRIYKSISAYGEGSAQQIEASKNALADRDKDLAELREATLAPFRSERDQLGIELANDIKAVEALHGAGSDVAQQATDFLKARYEIKIKELNYLAGETQRQIAILSQNIGLSTRQATDQLQDSIAKANMKPKDFELYSASKSWERGRADQQGAYEDREKEINAVDNKGDFLYEAEDRNKLLEEAHTEHLARMAVLDDEYANRTTTIAKDSARSKLEIEQTNIDAFGSLAGTLLGQQSSAAKAAFLLSKAYTVQRILLDKGAAMSSAYAEAKGGVFAKAMAAAKAGLENNLISDMINQVAMPTFTGIAHGGLDYVPSESTYLLDKGERVLSPKQNKDLTSFLSNSGKASNGDTNITITIDNNGNANMNSDNAAEVSKNLSLQIKNIVEATIRKEKRQGGML